MVWFYFRKMLFNELSLKLWNVVTLSQFSTRKLLVMFKAACMNGIFMKAKFNSVAVAADNVCILWVLLIFGVFWNFISYVISDCWTLGIYYHCCFTVLERVVCYRRSNLAISYCDVVYFCSLACYNSNVCFIPKWAAFGISSHKLAKNGKSC